MAKPTYKLRSPEKGAKQRIWETTSATEAVNLRAAGWTDVDEEAEAAEEEVATKQRAPRNKARSAAPAADPGSKAGAQAPSTNADASTTPTA